MRGIIWTLFLGLFLALTACAERGEKYDSDKEEILVRKIGHEISKYVGDSIQGLKPIKEVEERMYQIEFNSPFSFLSDSVIHIIDKELSKSNFTNDYVVKFEECGTSDVIFSYFISPKNADESVVSCLGREQAEKCYLLNIGFLPESNSNLSFFLLMLIGPLIIALIIYGIWQTRQVDKTLYEGDLQYKLADLDNIPLGLFGFNFHEQYLHIKEERIELTYKEATLMKILTDNQGKVVTREEIQKEVWDDDGSMISRSLDMFISKLRKKLKRDPNVEIKSIHGIGYKLIVS